MHTNFTQLQVPEENSVQEAAAGKGGGGVTNTVQLRDRVHIGRKIEEEDACLRVTY